MKFLKTVKSLRVWAKDQSIVEIFEKIFEFTNENLNGILIFNPFLSSIPGSLSFYPAIQIKTIFYNNLYGFGIGNFPLPPAGAS